jgi:hypothetical protein
MSTHSTGINVYYGRMQQRFLIDSLKMYSNKTRFANYHVPMYSGCKDFDMDPQTFIYGLFHWIPYFDKYKVMTIFENHVHSFKRTKPMRGNTPTDDGTVYLGDGAFGAIASDFCTPDKTTPIFDVQTNQNNFWISTVDNKQVQHSAYNTSGHIIDNFVQKVQSYVF